MPADQINDLMTLREVACRLRCSKAQAGRIIAGHVQGCSPLPSVCLGRRKLVRRDTLEMWIEANEHGVNSDRIDPSPVRDVGSSRIERKYA
jgi:hypothetical protein